MSDKISRGEIFSLGAKCQSMTRVAMYSQSIERIGLFLPYTFQCFLKIVFCRISFSEISKWIIYLQLYGSQNLSLKEDPD